LLPVSGEGNGRSDGQGEEKEGYRQGPASHRDLEQ
jgi:hypothetical protein